MTDQRATTDGGVVLPLTPQQSPQTLDGWFAREVPGIVRGLRSSGRISSETAGRAFDLLAEGHGAEALAVVMGEADI